MKEFGEIFTIVVMGMWLLGIPLLLAFSEIEYREQTQRMIDDGCYEYTVDNLTGATELTFICGKEEPLNGTN